MQSRNGVRNVLMIGIGILTMALGACDKRTAEEKGRDFAEEKVGFVEGATKVLKEKGKKIGESAGKGIGDLVKGTGSGIKDSINPPVKAITGPDMADSGVKILRAQEGKGTSGHRTIMVAAAFDKSFSGRFQLKALDAEGVERARSQPSENLSQAKGASSDISFVFKGDLRLSKIAHYELNLLAAKSVMVADALSEAGIGLSQLKESGHQVTLYLHFEEGYTGKLGLRVLNGDAKELGRSTPTPDLNQAVDSAQHMTFNFNPNTPMNEAAQYVLHPVMTPKKPAK